MKKFNPVLFLMVILLISGSSFASSETGDSSFLDSINNIFGGIVGGYAPILFYELPFVKLPMILFVMVSGGIFFTFKYGFINIRLLSTLLMLSKVNTITLMTKVRFRISKR